MKSTKNYIPAAKKAFNAFCTEANSASYSSVADVARAFAQSLRNEDAADAAAKPKSKPKLIVDVGYDVAEAVADAKAESDPPVTKKAGRPKKEVSEDEIAEVKKFISDGLTQKEIYAKIKERCSLKRIQLIYKCIKDQKKTIANKSSSDPETSD